MPGFRDEGHGKFPYLIAGEPEVFGTYHRRPCWGCGASAGGRLRIRRRSSPEAWQRVTRPDLTLLVSKNLVIPATDGEAGFPSRSGQGVI